MPGEYMRYTRKRKANALTKAGTRASSKRRRTSNVTKVRFQAPTARHQRRQIMANAKDIGFLKRMVKNQRVWCDWQRTADFFAQIDNTGSFTTTWGIYPLTDFSSWTPVMRTDATVSRSSTTFVKRLQLNMRYSLNDSDFASFSVFIVTLRPQSATYNPVATLPVISTDYIANTQEYNVRLNPAVFKVHYARQLQLMNNGYGEPAITGDTSGNPKTTFAKGQVNLQPHLQVRAPFGTPASFWTQLSDQDLPYYQRYYLMIYCNQTNPAGATPQSGARLTYDLLATTINSD